MKNDGRREARLRAPSGPVYSGTGKALIISSYLEKTILFYYPRHVLHTSAYLQ